MAKQTVETGTIANDGTGDELRTAFIKINGNFNEVYGTNFVTETMLSDNIVGAAELKVTGNGTDGQILKTDGDGTFSWIDNDEGDITEVTAGDGLTGGGTAGDVTLTVVGGTGITANANDIAITAGGVGATQLADDAVTNAKLGVEYTASVALTSGSAVAVDTALGDVFTMTAGASHTFNFTNVVIGDMKSLEITGSGGSYTSAFGTANGSACTFNKIGGTYSDAAAKQIIQIKWTAINNAWYQISQIA